jgi:hypothetical protein
MKHQERIKPLCWFNLELDGVTKGRAGFAESTSLY